MATLNEIKRRIAGVKNTQKITRAMKVVATTRLKKYEKMIFESKDFLDTLTKVFFQLTLGGEKLQHVLMEKNKEGGKCGFIVISSDRGLCGSFNSQLFRGTEEFITKEIGEENYEIFLIGAKAEQYFKRKNQEALFLGSRLSDEEKKEAARNVIEKVAELYARKELKKVFLVFNHYESRSNFGFKTLPILPFHYQDFVKEDFKKDGSSFLVEPSISVCLETLIPLFLGSLLVDSILQSQTAEELSRMLAMDYATENANELIEELTLAYNRRRQEVITKEISEIVGGAEALK